MPRPLFAALLAMALSAPPAFSQRSAFDSLARASLATIDGRLIGRGLRDTVRVLRDSWGVPHIYARNVDDLFFAQGFVHAQDRLWQMDMYRRVYEGRLAEILGPGAVRHDRLMRLMRFRGPLDSREFTSYHPDGRRILEAFARGVNAYIAQAGDRLPVEFKLTGLRPGRWTADVSLLRTQTAMPLADAREELMLARDVARYGAAEANRRWRPDPWRDLAVPQGFDATIVGDEVLAALRGLREEMPRPPLLPRYQALRNALQSPNRGAGENEPGSNNWVVSGALTATGKVILANDPHRNVSSPSIRYIVHLDAPGWSLIGSTEAPLPGIGIGHNGRIGWGLTILGTDQADVYVEQLNPANPAEVRWNGRWERLRSVRDTIRVRNGAPVVVTLKWSRHGPIFHVDTARHVAYAMRSTMYEPGTAGYLGALRYQRVDDCRQFLDAQTAWKAPAENMICGDVHGNIAWNASGLAPRRAGWDGRLPVPGSGAFEWAGFRSDQPRELNPERGWIATANNNTQPPTLDPPLFFLRGDAGARYRRVADLLTTGRSFTVEDFMRFQHDAYSVAAARTVELFKGWTASTARLERARRMLAEWDATFRRESPGAALYYYAARLLPLNVADSAMSGASQQPPLERALAGALDSLRARVGSADAFRWGQINRTELPHSLVAAYDIPGIERSGGAGTMASIGATFREIIDFASLDRSMVTNLPGQSAQPGSPFYANLVAPFAREEYFSLLYSREAVESAAKYRLMLVPVR